jgi:hypothetical protein
MKILKGKRKVMKEGREKPIWNDVGFTVLIGDWEGKTTYTLIDERTGEKYSLFDIEYGSSKKNERSEESAPTNYSPDDVPF